MTEKLTIETERIDDIPVLLAQMKEAVDESAGDGASSNPFGALSAKDRTRVFKSCVAKDIRPRLDRLGY